MSSQELPNTESLATMQAAIAWEIAKRATQLYNANHNKTPEQIANLLTKLYIEAFNRIRSGEPLQDT